MAHRASRHVRCHLSEGREINYQGAVKMEIGMAEKRPEIPGAKTGVVGISQAVQEALHLCLKAGRSDIPVLICGET